MKKVIAIMAVLIVVMMVLSINQVAASSEDTITAKKTPGAQATAQAIRKAGADQDGIVAEKGKPQKAVNRRGEIVSAVEGSLVISLRDETLLTVTLTEDTIVKIPGKNTELSDMATGLLVGMKVNVRGVLGEDGSLTAQRITVIPGKPVKMSNIGVVSAYTPDVSIEITDKKGEIFVYLLDLNTRYLPEERMAELQVGSLVTIISPRDVTGAPAKAAGVVIHPAGTELPDESEEETIDD
jgi:uncharacterized protein YdeI (BOF family)